MKTNLTTAVSSTGTTAEMTKHGVKRLNEETMIMKTINRIALVSTACIVMFGCAKDDSADNFAETTATMKVVVNDEIGTSRVAFADGEGIAWENGDHECFYRIVKNLEGAVKASEIATESDGKTATFTFPAVDAGSEMWFMYTPSINVAGAKLECTFPAQQTQSAAGRMDKTNIFLLSDMQTVGDEEVISPKMRLVGTVQRFLVYSATGAYADESIESVEMKADENIAGLIGYNTAGEPINFGGEVQDAETIYWSESNTAKVTVSAPSQVAATSREATLGHGIYLSVPPVTVSAGYTYTITTDKATYTLVGTSAKTFNNGELVNIFVNLESQNVRRVDLSARKLEYAGGLGDSYTVSSDANTYPLGWWAANVEGSTMQNTAENAELYTNVEFSITDEAGNSVDWITCGYRANDTWWDAVCEANTSAEPRTAVITATFTAPNYNIVNPTKTVRVTQGGYKAIADVEYKFLAWKNEFTVDAAERKYGDVSNMDNLKFGQIVVSVNGVDSSDATTRYFTDIVYESSADWLGGYMMWGNQFYAWCNANETGETRTGTITMTLPVYDDANLLNTERVITITVTQTAE